MFRIGIIGAGTISNAHIEAYINNPECEIAGIADLNTELAQKKADEYKIPVVTADYHDLLNDKSIDAVSVLVPTFLHKKVTIEALKSGKHVLCEKPPAMNPDEVKECIEVSKQTGKVLMYALVCRFRNQVKYLKEYIEAGKMGNFVSADIERTRRCGATGSWFMNKSKSGGGVVFDVVIHEIDLMMYLMGYPKVKSVTGTVNYSNRDLPEKIKGAASQWYSSDKTKYENDVETSASAYITLENGAYLFVKTSSVLMLPQTAHYMQLCGEKAGARMEPSVEGKQLKLIELDDQNYIREVTPVVEASKMYQGEVDHFVDCCLNGTECICKLDEAVKLVEILCAIYKSAELGETIYFN